MVLAKRRGVTAILGALTAATLLLIAYRTAPGKSVEPLTLLAVLAVFAAGVTPVAIGLVRERQRARFSLAGAVDDPIPAHETLLHLRCGECGTTFDARDAGVRPMRTDCPGCGRPGILRASTLQPVSGDDA